MKIKTIIPVGLGAGHTTFAPSKNIAFVTNHKDTFSSVIDTKKHTLIKNVQISAPQINNTFLQSHTIFFHPIKDSFYTFSSDNGIFHEVSLNYGGVYRVIHTGGTPLQGVFLCDGQSCSGME